MASRLHKRVRRLIKELLGSVISEEVNVQKLFPSYPVRNQHYDMVIPSYNLVIECHGEQHRNPQSFGEKNADKVMDNFKQQRYRDKNKENIVWDNGWGYVCIWFDDLPKDDVEAKKIIKAKIMESLERIEDE